MSWLEFGPEPLLAPCPPAPQRARLHAAVLGLGTALPATVVANATIQDRLGVEGDWIERRTGIRERRVLGAGETLAELSREASQAALDDAGTSAGELDLIVAATSGGDDIIPHLAPMVGAALGAHGCAAYDVGAACTGFVAALSVAAGAVESGRARKVLLLGADAMARWTDPDDRTTAALFGDGAGAIVLGAAPGGGGVGPVVLHADGDDHALVKIDREQYWLRMDGHGTYRRAVSSMVEATLEAIELAGLTPEQIDRFVYHQANRRILAAVAARLEVDPARVVDAIAGTGNTSAASLPLALAAARERDELQAGERVLLGAAGSGFCWGAGVVTW